MDISQIAQENQNLQTQIPQQEQSTLISEIQKDQNVEQTQIDQQIALNTENTASKETNQINQILQSNEENKLIENEQPQLNDQKKDQQLLTVDEQSQKMQEELEIPTDKEQLVLAIPEKKKQGNSQPFRFEQYLPKRETRSQAENRNGNKSNSISSQQNKPKQLSRKQAEVAEMMKEEQLDQKTRGKKNINYKILVNQPQQFGNELPQKGLRAKDHKLQAKQQKKNHENQNNLEESDFVQPTVTIEQPQKKRGRPSLGSNQQFSSDQPEKNSTASRKGKNNGNQNQAGSSQNLNASNANSKLLSSILEGGATNNTSMVNENSNSQAFQQQSQQNQQTSYSSDQAKKSTEIPFRSDAPDYLLALIDNTIERDIHSFLRKKFAGNHIDEVIEPSNMITQKVKKHGRLQYYLPFEQTKLYQYKDVILESIQSQSSKKNKKKKSTSNKNKKKIPPSKCQQKNQKQQGVDQQNNTIKNDLMEQSQQQDDENSQTFTASQNGDIKLQLQNDKSIEIQVSGYSKQNNNDDVAERDCQQINSNVQIENSQNRSNSQASQSQNNNSVIISPQQSQNSNNEEDQMDIEDDDQIDEQQILEEVDDNNSDEDIFEEYINQFTYEDEIRQIETSNLSSYFKQLFLNDFNFQIPLKDFSYSKINYSEIIPQPQLNCLTQTKMNSIDAIRARAENNTYYEFQEFDRDMRKLFNYTLRFRCKSVQSFQYMTYLIKDYYEFVKKNNSINQIEVIKRKDIHTLVRGDLDNKMQVKKWPIIPTSYRNYIQITEYDPQPPSFEKQIKEKLKSKKEPVKCDKKCVCNSFSKMGDFNLEACTWNSKCLNRASRVECIECECKNQQISKNERQVVGRDVEETLCWGIDLYTKKNIFYILPERYSDEQKNMFIQFQLMKAINLQKDKGWDIIHCCNFILERSQNKKQRLEEQDAEIAEPKFNEDSRKCAKSIIKAIKYIKKALIDQNIDPENLYSEAFRIHTKGMGLICINPKGIEQNEFITEYIGEIFPPWRWFEKQDTIKKYMKENNKRDILPDFWNIMLEIHKDDPKGYDILFVDPILKGNFSSRLSHSCEPNCGTVPTITNTGNYVIAMFAMHPIEYGEELSFDYMAVTESIQEHKRAICLCGSSKCRGRYLELSNSNIKQFNQILEKIHCFLNRTYTLYIACTEELNEEDENILEQYSFRSNIRENSPKWLQKWAALVLRIINQEYDLFLEELVEAEKKKVQKEESLVNLTQEQINQKIDLPYLKYLAQSRKDARIQNIVISIDKIKYYTNQINDSSPPLLNMQNDQLLENYWIKTENTLKDDLLEVLQQIHSKVINYQLVEYAHIIITNATKKIQIFQKFGQFDHGLLVVRVVVLIISDFFLQMKNCNLQSDALSLILHFHAFTHKYFKTHSYKKFTSEEQIIQKEDIINVELFDEDQQGNIQEFTAYSDKKTYTSLFVWGQLNMWYKQSVTNPATTLSLERRGPLIYPQLSNSFKESSTLYPFVDNKQAENPKQVFMDHLKTKPECYWPGDNFNKWSFKNQMSQYGSFMYDSFCYSNEFPNYIEQVLEVHQKSFKEKMDFLKEVEIKLSGLSMQAIEDIINSVIEDSPESYYETIHGVKKNVKLNQPSPNIQKSEQVQSAAAEALTQATQKRKKTTKGQPLDEVLDTTKNLKQDIQNQIIQGGNILNNNLISFMQSPQQQAQQQQNQLQQNILLTQYQQQFNGFLDNSTIKNLDQIIYQQQQQQINQPQQNTQQKQNQQILEQLKNPINDITKVSPPLAPYFNNTPLNQFQNNLLSQPYQAQSNSLNQGYLNMQAPVNQAAQQLINQTNTIQQYQQQQHQQVQQQQQQPQYQQQHHQKLQQHQFQNQNQIIGLGSQQIFQNSNQYQQQQNNPHQLIQNQIQLQNQQQTQQNAQYLPQQQQNLIQGQPQQHTIQQVNYGIQSQNIYQNQNNQLPLQQMQQNPQLFSNVLQHPQSQQQQHLRMQQNYQLNQQQSQSQPLIGNSNQINQQQQGSKSQQSINLASQANMMANYSNQQISKTLDNMQQIPAQQQMSQVQQAQRLSQNDIGSLAEINSQKSLGNIPGLHSPAAISGGISPILAQGASAKKIDQKKLDEKSSAPTQPINNSPSSQQQQSKQDQKQPFPPQLSAQAKEQQPAQNPANPQQNQIQQAPNLISQNQLVQQPNQQINQIDQSRGKNLVINTGNNYRAINFFASENDSSLLNAQQTLQKQYSQGSQQYQAQYQNPYNTTVSQQINNTFGLNYFDDPTSLIKYQNYDQQNQGDDSRNRNSSMMSNNSFLSQKNAAGNPQNPLLAQQIQNQMEVISSAIGNYPSYNINPSNNFLNQFSMQQNSNFLGQTGYPQGQFNGLDDKVSMKNTPPPTPQQPAQFNLYSNNLQQFSQYPTELSLNRTSSYGGQQNMYSQQTAQNPYNSILNQEQDFSHRVNSLKSFQQVAPINANINSEAPNNSYQKNEIASPSSFFEKTMFSNACNQESNQNFAGQQLPQLQQQYSRSNQQQQQQQQQSTGQYQLNYTQNEIYQQQQQQQHLQQQQAQPQSENTGNAEQATTATQKNIDQNFI
ncbi:SET domain protein (macronuclear) [Tetrahymena thermophila SB210]|uniref:SET domain protein n=1 Tax=Tetrahymena thermophila (strain SB210) TaxID=312017 RepID=I7MMD1_TETTS|nr:SET domain protein [Tetrahymena thermophila SB210]EAS04619.2 SET domain protein [Tetrahymena thermophila SB210]|eukprot:XP_001024864.2 SET domain protein [Tetrahymena thermophila SB210]